GPSPAERHTRSQLHSSEPHSQTQRDALQAAPPISRHRLRLRATPFLRDLRHCPGGSVMAARANGHKSAITRRALRVTQTADFPLYLFSLTAEEILQIADI